MKTTPLVVAALAAAGLLSPSAKANTNSDHSKNMQNVVQQRSVPRERVVLVQTTESRIPHRVVIAGNQVNGSSPLYVLQSRDLLRTGATDVGSMLLKSDPSITVRRP